MELKVRSAVYPETITLVSARLGTRSGTEPKARWRSSLIAKTYNLWVLGISNPELLQLLPF